MGFFRLLATALPCLALGAGTATQAAPLSSFEARYDVELRGLLVASLTRNFTLKADGSYEFESVLESRGVAALIKPITEREFSRGQWVDDAPHPTSYVYEKQSVKKQRSAHVDFDWKSKTVSGQDGGKQWKATLTQGVVDKLAYQLLLMRDLARDAKLEYRLADDGRIKTQSWVRAASEDLRLGDKTIPVVKVVQQARGGRQTRLWCAPGLNFLPVRIEYQEKDGEVTSALLRSR